jgi:hypothetical protein
MELEREIMDYGSWIMDMDMAEAMDLSIKPEGDEVHHCATFVSHY